MGDYSADEFLDVLAPDGSIIGTASRLEVHRQGLWHRTFHCLVVRPGLPARVVFQRRSEHSHFAGKLDFTASGHLAAGEQPVDGIRELEEETGLRVSADELTHLGVQIIVDHRDDVINQEQVHVFLVSSDLPLDRFSPDRREVAGLVEVETGPLLSLVDADDPTASITGLEWNGDGSSPPAPVTIGHADLMSGYDNYLIKVLVMAERFAAGIGPVAI